MKKLNQGKYLVVAALVAIIYTHEAKAQTTFSCSAVIENSRIHVAIDRRADHFGNPLLSIDIYENGELVATDAPAKETPLILGAIYEGKRFVLREVRQGSGAEFSDKKKIIPSFKCK